MRHAQLFAVVHGAAGTLLAVAESGIEEDDLLLIYAHDLSRFRTSNIIINRYVHRIKYHHF